MISLRLIHSKLIILLFILCSCSENPEADKLNSSEEVVEVKAKDTIEPYQIDAVTDSLIADFTFRILKGDSSLTLISWGYNKDSIRKFSMGVNSEIRFENKFNFYQDQQDNVFYVNHLTEDTIPVTNRKKRITLVPCSNGYLYMSQGICVNDELEKLLDESELNYSPFPLANMHGKGFSGIYSF